jgi:hypothetical protein
MSMVILALCKVQNVSFHKLALAFDNESKPESSLRRLQRFVADLNLCKDLIARLIFSLLNKKENSNSEERISLIDRFIKLFGKDCIDCISADREVCW